MADAQADDGEGIFRQFEQVDHRLRIAPDAADRYDAESA